MGLRWDPWPFASMRMAASERAFPSHLHTRDCQMSHSSDPTPTHPRLPRQVQLLVFVHSSPGSLGRKWSLLGVGVGAAREGGVVNAGGHKASALSQSHPTVNGLLAAAPSFPTMVLSSQEEGQALGCQEYNPPFISLPPTQCWGTGFLGA